MVHCGTSATSKPAAEGGERSSTPSSHSCLAPIATAALKAATLRKIDRSVHVENRRGADDLPSPERTSCVGSRRSPAGLDATSEASCSRMGPSSPAAGSRCSDKRTRGAAALGTVAEAGPLRIEARLSSPASLRFSDGAVTDTEDCASTGWLRDAFAAAS
eukprot:5820558-Pleurochrysis_carterae.AAC.2